MCHLRSVQSGRAPVAGLAQRRAERSGEAWAVHGHLPGPQARSVSVPGPEGSGCRSGSGPRSAGPGSGPLPPAGAGQATERPRSHPAHPPEAEAGPAARPAAAAVPGCPRPPTVPALPSRPRSDRGSAGAGAGPAPVPGRGCPGVPAVPSPCPGSGAPPTARQSRARRRQPGESRIPLANARSHPPSSAHPSACPAVVASRGPLLEL